MSEPAKRIGIYEIIEPLGRGGTSTRFLARDPHLDRLVTVKVLAFDDEESDVALAREVRSAARLRHPNIEAVFEFGEDEERRFVVTEYIRGETLAEIIRQRRPLPLTRKIQIVEGVCSGLDYAHRAGLIHRDINPSNIMVSSEGEPKILDFGVKAMATGLTQSGIIVAALSYLSPEQISGADIDQRSDVFATGAVLYELLTYQKAFAADNAAGTLLRIVNEEPTPAATVLPGLPADLDRIIANSLKKDPSQRYSDAGMMQRDLLRVRQVLIRQDESPESEPPTASIPSPARSPESATRVVDRESLARHRTVQLERHLSEAQQFFDRGRFEDAIAACEQALLIDPDDPRAAEMMGRTRAVLDEQVMRERERERSRRVEELVARARKAMESRKYNPSIERLEEALAIDPAHAESLDLLRRLREAVASRAEEERRASEARDRRQADAEARRSAEEAARHRMPQVVPVFYATDRARNGRITDRVAYGSERSLTSLAYGCTFVSIPPSHRRGHLERPSILKLEFREHPDRHVVALDVTEYTKETFFDLLRKALSHPDERSTFVFIHGFNVDFNEAVRRTAQLGFDLGLQHAPILYSWPSQGSALQYIADTNAAMWTVPHLAEFLHDLQQESGATSIHLIAHSMGNQALTGALRLLRGDNRQAANLFKQIVLTAPDLDAHVFERDLAPRIVGIGERTTLYASSRDEILIVSKRLNAYRRAGDAAEGIVVVEGVDSIDASDVSTGLGHSAYGDVRTVVEDLSLLLRLGLPPGSRNLITRGVPPRQHWAFPA